MTTEEKIKNALRDTYNTQKEFTTTISAIINVVTEKYNDLKRDQVESALANMNGWERTGESLLDQAKISPSFFN